jgi:hypothetical protein
MLAAPTAIATPTPSPPSHRWSAGAEKPRLALKWRAGGSLDPAPHRHAGEALGADHDVVQEPDFDQG